MTEQAPSEKITTAIWREEPEADDPFTAAACYCGGYDVYGDVLEKAGYIGYLYLLLKQEKPSECQQRLLNGLAIALANPGPRDHSVRAAMCAGVGGSTHASALISAIAAGAGNYGGAREVYTVARYWHELGCDLEAWVQWLEHPPGPDQVDVWQEMEHPPGFAPHGVSCSQPVRQTLDHLSAISSEFSALQFLQQQRPVLERHTSLPLAMSGVAGAALFDLGMSANEAEMLFLLLRLPGAAAHALEQEKMGWRRYPYFKDAVKLTNDPGFNVDEETV